MKNPFTQRVDFESFEEFFQKIVLENQKLDPGRTNHDKPLYRGHGSSEYKLVPSALREINTSLFVSRNSKEEASERAHIYGEFNRLGRYWSKSHSNGLMLPVDNDIADGIFLYDAPDYELFDKWPPKGIAELLAHAQHQGMPTRALDWSRDIWVAAHFAASGALDRCLHLARSGESFDKEKMSIWQMDPNISKYFAVAGENSPLKRITPNYQMNTNAQRQDGTLTYWEIDMPYNDSTKPVDRRPLNELIVDFMHSSPIINETLKNNPNYLKGTLAEFTIPAADAPDALRKLSQFKYSPSKLFTNGVGILQELKQEDNIKEFESLQGPIYQFPQR